jgi:hypothetical protein
MNGARTAIRRDCSLSGRGWLFGLVLLLPVLAMANGDRASGGNRDNGQQTKALGKNLSPAGMLLTRTGPGQPWQVLKVGAGIGQGGDVVGLPGTEPAVNLPKEGLKLAFHFSLPGQSSSPSRESAVRLDRDGEGMLVIRLNRGRVALSQSGEAGTHRVLVAFAKELWDISLDEADSEVLLERLNGWKPGVPLPKKGGQRLRPDTDVFLFVQKGRVTLRAGANQFTMGPGALYRWSAAGGAVGPIPLKGGIAAFLKKGGDEPGAKTEALLKEFTNLRRLLGKEPVAQALKNALKDPSMQQAAAFTAGALGDVGLLLTALEDSGHAGIRETAVISLRHWLGQDGGHPAALYKSLLQRRNSPGQADTFLHLLHTFSGRDRTRPETYDTLIAYLQHGHLGIRELARWQLCQMVPKGRDIAYDAAATPAERARMQAAWRKLIPAGQVPAPETKEQP